jgi:hypothetical protein
MNSIHSHTLSKIPLGVLIAILLLTASAFAQPDRFDAFRVQLWNPNHPVDILTYNPNHEKMKLPEPMDIPTLSEFHGPGFTETSLTKDILVGNNITISIDYQDGAGEGFYDATLGSSRRSAFSAAMAIWASLLQGPATITIAAHMTPRGGSPGSATLASSGPVNYWKDFANAPLTDTWYPAALVEIISGSDPDAAEAEIAVDFNSDVDDTIVLGDRDWYYGTDANPGSDIDFMMVTLHEMCHGFGMISSFDSSGHWGGGTPYPFIFDRFLVDSSGTKLITKPVSRYNVRGNNVFWTGTIAKWAYTNDFGGSFKLPIYAPSSWDRGSSMSHIDEATFSETIWELITPEYDGDIMCIHDPDLICLGIFQDIGHSLSKSRYVDLGASGFEDGSSGNPFNTLSEGIANVPTSGNGHLRLFPDSYSGAMILTQAMIVHSCGGRAYLGTAKGVESTSPPDSLLRLEAKSVEDRK